MSKYILRIENLLRLLQRFPQCAYLENTGGEGDDDLRVYAPVDGSKECLEWDFYRIDAEDSELPWLHHQEREGD